MAEASTPLDDNEEILSETLNCNGNISHPPSAGKSGKRDRLGHIGGSEVVSHNSYSLRDESSKKAKRELPSDPLSSPNSTFKVKKHQRNYRPRVMDSSSEDESNSLNLPDASLINDSSDTALSLNNQNSSNGVCNDVQSDKNDSENSVNNEVLNLNNSNASTGATNEAEEEVDQSSRNVSGTSQETEASSAAQMETNQSLPTSRNRMRRLLTNFSNLDSDDSDDSDDDESEDGERRERSSEERASQRRKLDESVSKELNVIMDKRKPKSNWNSLQAVIDRQYGMRGNRQSAVLFTNRYYDSLHVVKRLQLVSKLNFHMGCTNALNFNESGDVLASSSDDLQIAIWDWTKEKTSYIYNSGHRNNVFQCKFLPLSGNTRIASCARDGQVRLAEITPSGVYKDNRRLAKHSRSAHKLAIRVNTPFELMSAGEDAFVYNIDIRADQPDKIVLVKDVHGSRVPLYSIHQHPLDDNQFCVSGQDEYVRVYDRRIISPFGPPVLKYCPSHLVDKKPKSNITCAVYSNNGDAILASYNDEDIYLFDTSLSEGADPAHRYSGHRNSSTVKGVNFFSPSSQFVVSGSDCGNIFIWDRETEAIVNCMPGDDNGVVNVLEPHPHLPVLATSGLDNEIKVWVPSHAEDPKLGSLSKTVRSNVSRRLRESNDDSQGLDSHMLMVLFQHLRRNPTFRGRPRSGSVQAQNQEDDDDDLGVLDSSEDSSSDDNDDSDDSDLPNRGDVVQCSTH